MKWGNICKSARHFVRTQEMRFPSLLFFLPCPHSFRPLFVVLINKFARRSSWNTLEKPCGRLCTEDKWRTFENFILKKETFQSGFESLGLVLGVQERKSSPVHPGSSCLFCYRSAAPGDLTWYLYGLQTVRLQSASSRAVSHSEANTSIFTSLLLSRNVT